jgi:broad specificity phosphatase PhoE
MVSIRYEVHATTVDNENKVCSGVYDAELSEAGVQQAKELGERNAHDQFAAIFCSDLQRSYKTAELAFGESFHILRDPRLRECDYGELTRCPRSVMDKEQPKHISKPFPNGESYEQVMDRMHQFLVDLLWNYNGQRVLVVGHGATRAGLEHWLNGLKLEDAVAAAKDWQPGWEYELKNMPPAQN